MAGFQASATSHAGPPWIQRMQGRRPVRCAGLRNQPCIGRPSKLLYVTCSARPSGRSVKCSLRVSISRDLRLYLDRLGGLERLDHEKTKNSPLLAGLMLVLRKPAWKPSGNGISSGGAVLSISSV